MGLESAVQKEKEAREKKLEEKKEASLKAFEEARKDIEQRIFTEKAQEKFEEFMKELREKSYIKILNPNPLDF